MNTTERQLAPFQTLGEVSRLQLLVDGIACLPYPLEPGTVLTFEMIAEWLGEPFPIARYAATGPFVERGYEPMGDVIALLLKRDGTLLLADPGVGYRVASSEEKYDWAAEEWRRAKRRIDRARLAAESVDRYQVTHSTWLAAEQFAVDAREESRVMRAKQRARDKIRDRWT